MKRPATMFEKQHMGKVAALGCVLCRYLGNPDTPAQVHHIRDGQGIGQRASHYLTIPLCHFHHQGDGGIHGLGVKGFFTRYKLDELDLLAMTISMISVGRM